MNSPQPSQNRRRAETPVLRGVALQRAERPRARVRVLRRWFARPAEHHGGELFWQALTWLTHIGVIAAFALMVYTAIPYRLVASWLRQIDEILSLGLVDVITKTVQKW